MNKQTAVKFLIKEFSDILGQLDTKPMQDLLLMDAMKKAKEMEKEQVVDAYDAGLFDGTMDDVKDRIYNNYYKETFGG